ncbi:MAG: Hpt domain-containing protein [Sphingomonas sp. 28-66-16]|nr:MAG: Hpt domain-containing protein [Sphingomonas sp. 28-66-16]
MAYDPGAIDAALVAAVGDEPALIAELRMAFLDSAQRSLDLLEHADSVDDWRAAALRLKGLGASFGAIRLMALADETSDLPVGDKRALQRLRRAIERL